MGRVVIGMDGHKQSATIEVIDEQERALASGRYATDTDGYRRMLAAGRQFPSRVWAVEGCRGIGRHVAQRLVADGETVLDVNAIAASLPSHAVSDVRAMPPRSPSPATRRPARIRAPDARSAGYRWPTVFSVVRDRRIRDLDHALVAT